MICLTPFSLRFVRDKKYPSLEGIRGGNRIKHFYKDGSKIERISRKNDEMFLQNCFETIIVKVESYPSFFCGHGKSSIVVAITPMRSTTWCQELWMKKNPSPFNLEGTVQCGVFLSKFANKGHLISKGLFDVFNSTKK